MKYVTSKNGLHLVERFADIPNVAQVRYHHVLRKNLPFTNDAIFYTLWVKSLDQTGVSDVPGDFIYTPISTILEPEDYEDVSKHGWLQAIMNERVGYYYRTGEKTDNPPSINYPYSYNSDGSANFYNMTDSNPLR